MDQTRSELAELLRNGTGIRSVIEKALEIYTLCYHNDFSLRLQKDLRDVVVVCQDDGFYLFQ